MTHYLPPAFEIRPDEELYLDPDNPEYWIGIFPIPLPGPMAICQSTGKPADAMRLSMAEVLPDKTIRWMAMGVGTHIIINQIFDQAGLEHCQWHGIRFVKKENP